MVYSFDIYDTLITRITAEPIGIFYYMAQRMKNDQYYENVPRFVIDDFVRIRECAESLARVERGGEILLDDIYEMMARNYVLSCDVVKQIKELEIECEIYYSIPINDNVDRVKKLLQKNEKVILITDMYHDKAFFHRLLDEICPELSGVPLYISGEEKVSKASGKLFERVKTKENLSYEDWKHIGDNVVSDDSIPALLGITTELYVKNNNIDDINRILCMTRGSEYYLSSILQGLGKIHTANVNCNGYRIGYSFVGVVLFAYVDWIINQSMSRNIKALYFIARDGYILQKIADIIIEKESISMETKYLYGSRKAWRTNDDNEVSILKEYLHQEIKERPEEYALVDTQGTGLSIDYISRIMGHTVNVFYYTLIESSSDKNINPIMYSSYSGADMIEVFCRAPHGSTQGYCKQDGKIVPVLSDVSSDIYESNGFNKYVEGILDFASDYMKYTKWLNQRISLSKIADIAVAYCVYNPDKSLADFIGDVPHDSENASENMVYAPVLSETDIKRIEYDRRTQYIEEVYNGVNLLYSYKRLDDSLREKVDYYRNKYYTQQIEKDENAIRVIIYGFGIYGQELYHRLFGASNVVVTGVVDANYKKYNKDLVQVDSLERLKTSDYDYVVISLLNKRVSGEIKELLVSAGVPESVVFQRDDFIKKYIES